MSPEQLKQLIEASLPDATVIVQSDDNVHFSANVISSQFIGKTRVQQQQLVYAGLQQYISAGTIHALALKTYTPDAWQSTGQSL